jgi:GMP synthase-like glutamine amidotransferase
MNIHVFQHVPFEGLGSISRWADGRGAQVRTTRFYDDPTIPALDDINLLIAMGGPMSVNDEAALPWLIAEKQCIRDAVARGIPTLGVCLGAQLIASALGAKVYRQADKEIGWLPIAGGTTAAETFAFPAHTTVFHWHGETFDLPPGAMCLASSTACPNQAFAIDGHVLGLQCHLEATPEAVATLVEYCGDELVPGRYVQAAAEILAASASTFHTSNRLMERLLDQLTRGDR